MTSPDQPERSSLREIAAAGPWRGPSYTYRGARIECLPGGHVCGLFMNDHPLHGATFGVPGTVTPLIDMWLDERRLPDHMRVVPRPSDP